MVIQIDTREHQSELDRITNFFKAKDITYVFSKCYVGDYVNMSNPLIVVDRKKNLTELCNNISTVPKKDKYGKIKRYPDGRVQTEWNRFTDELQRASEVGIHMVILCEHGGAISKLTDVELWNNPRLKESPLATSGEQLMKKLMFLESKYDVEFQFCHKGNTGRRIVEILENTNGE